MFSGYPMKPVLRQINHAGTFDFCQMPGALFESLLNPFQPKHQI
jgi:hypothetical protein